MVAYRRRSISRQDAKYRKAHQENPKKQKTLLLCVLGGTLRLCEKICFFLQLPSRSPPKDGRNRPPHSSKRQGAWKKPGTQALLPGGPAANKPNTSDYPAIFFVLYLRF